MITWNPAALARIGLSVEAANEIVGLSSENEEALLLARAQRIRPPVKPGQPPVLHSTLAIREYAEMAESLGYRVRRS